MLGNVKGVAAHHLMTNDPSQGPVKEMQPQGTQAKVEALSLCGYRSLTSAGLGSRGSEF